MGQTFPRTLLFGFMGVALLTLGACDFFVSDESRIQRANQLRTKGDYRAAAVELKKVLQSHPDNRDARLLLGEVSVLIGEPAAAEKELRRAQDLGIPKDRVVITLGQALLDQGQFDRALQELDPAGITNDEAKADVLMLRGQVYLALGKLEDSERAFREVLALRADSLDARIGLAGVEHAKRNLKAAEAYIADALSRDPTYARAWLARGQLELGRGQYTQAEDAFTRALKPPVPVVEEFLALNGLSESQWRQGKSDAALQNVERLMKLAPQHPRPKYLRALIAYGTGDYKTVKENLQEVLRGFPDYRPAAFLLGATHYAQGELEQADMYLNSVLATDPSNVLARKLLAATRLRQHKPQDAVAALTPVLAQNTDDPQLLALMGRASLQAGDTDTGVAYLERSAGNEPSNQALQMQLALGYVTGGDLEQAIKLLENMPETEHGAYGRELLLILAHLRRGDSESAMTQVHKLLARRPNDIGAYNLAGNVCMAAGQMRRAREHFDKALQLQPDNLAVLLSLGRLEFWEGKQDNARAHFERVLALSANNLNAMVALAQLSSARGDQAGAAQWLERASAANPQALEPRLRLVGHYLDAGDADRARSLITDLANSQPGSGEVQNALGIVQMADGKHAEAAASFRKAVEAAPNSASFSYNLARAELALRHPEAAKKLLTKTLELRPGDLQASSTLAALEMQEGNAQQALARARQLQQDKETATAGHVLEGDLHMMQRKFDSAARAYDVTSRQAESSLLALKSYEARRQGGMPDAAKPLEEWLSKHPDDARVRFALAQSLQERGQLKQAAAEYELVLKSYPDHAATLNNLAWTYQETGDPRAISTAEHAHQLQPDNGAIADTLGWLLVQDGQAQRAVELLRKAVKQAPNMPDIRYHLAVALAKTGANEEARRTLAEVVNSGQNFKELAKAKQLLQSL